MKISELKITNFRSLRSVTITTGAFNVLVGKNNHGKTNTFKAIEWFYGGKGDLNEIRNSAAAKDAMVEVEITFSGVKEGLNQITNADNQTKMKAILGDNDTMKVKRSSSDPKSRLIFNPTKGNWQKQPTGTDPAFNNCIPRFEFVEATKNLGDVSGFSTKSPIGQMLGGVLSEVLEKDQTYKEFHAKFEELFHSEGSGIQAKLKSLSAEVKKHLQQQFPDCAALRFAVEEPTFDDLLKNFTTRLDDGVETDAEDKGDGMQRALMLAIIKTHADHRRAEALGKSFIFFIDEAELHLHPTAQRQLKLALLELSEGVDQVFINTHSSVLIADDNAKQSIFCVEKKDGVTGVELIGKVAKQDVIYQLLGGNPADLLLPNNFIIVEGRSEYELLTRVIRRFYPDKVQIQILMADGDIKQAERTINALNVVFKPLAARPIYRDILSILCDKPNAKRQAEFDTFKAQNPHLEKQNQIRTLPKASLEESYPAPWSTAAHLKGPEKVALAIKVGDEIAQAQFEADLQVVFEALTHCWDKAYPSV